MMYVKLLALCLAHGDSSVKVSSDPSDSIITIIAVIIIINCEMGLLIPISGGALWELSESINKMLST